MPKTVDHQQILAGARRALARHGARGMTLEEIAAEAGVSRVTLYRRGASRESILAELAEAAAEEYRQALWPALTGRGSGRERLEAALAALCEAAEANLALLIELQRDADSLFHEPQPAGAGDAVATRSQFTDPLERIVRDGQADGTLAAGDPLELATLLFNLIGGTYTHLRAGHRWPPERARDAVVGIALDGVAAD